MPGMFLSGEVCADDGAKGTVFPGGSRHGPVIELSCGAAVIRITNDIPPQLLSQVIRAAEGLSC